MRLENINKHFSLIAIASGKGGVGKSTLTASLAHALTDLGFSVGVLDADVYGPSMPIMLPPNEGVKTLENRIKPAISSKIKVMSLGFFKQGEKASIVRAPIANATIHQFLHEVDWGDIDVLLIDLPPGTGDIHLTLMQSVSLTKALVITTPQAVSVSDVRKSMEMFQKMNVEMIGIIENMSYYIDSMTQEKHFLFGEGGGELLSKEFSVPLLAKIPVDPSISIAMDAGSSLFAKGGSLLCKEAILEIAIEISKEICDDSETKKSFIELKELDAYHVGVDLGDGIKAYRYSDIQRSCPCARCFDRVYLKRMVDTDTIDEYVGVTKIEKMGQYGMRLQFRSGCKQGIYTWQHLEALS